MTREESAHECALDRSNELGNRIENGVEAALKSLRLDMIVPADGFCSESQANDFTDAVTDDVIESLSYYFDEDLDSGLARQISSRVNRGLRGF